MTAPIMRVENITRRLEGEVPVTLIDGVSLEVNAGEFVVIMGPSGSGKSSLLYMLGLLDTPTTGKIYLGDIDTTILDDDHLAETRLSQLGFVFQFHFLLPEFTALENVTLPMRRLEKLSEKEATERATSVLESLGMKDQLHKLPQQMSGGQCQRVAIARALANNPMLILADEPTGSLDTSSGTKVREILRELVTKQGRAVIVVTHEPKFTEIADRIITIVDGKIHKE